MDREKPGREIINGTALYRVPVLAVDQGSPALTSTTTVRHIYIYYFDFGVIDECTRIIIVKLHEILGIYMYNKVGF